MSSSCRQGTGWLFQREIWTSVRVRPALPRSPRGSHLLETLISGLSWALGVEVVLVLAVVGNRARTLTSVRRHIGGGGILESSPAGKLCGKIGTKGGTAAGTGAKITSQTR